MKIFSWNVNGLRSILAKNFQDFLLTYKPDLICLQECKIHASQLSEITVNSQHYQTLYSLSDRKGYSGVATFYTDKFTPKKVSKGINSKIFDSEGRFLITEHPHFTLYNVYFPSGTMGETRQDFKYRFLDKLYDHLKSLSPKIRNKLIICGDFNICHKEIDIHHPVEATKRKLTGFLPEERKWVDKFVKLGFIDTFRYHHGNQAHRYSWWTFRAGARKKNLGWRIDYIFVAKALTKKIKDAEIHENILGSDHCPISLTLAP